MYLPSRLHLQKQSDALALLSSKVIIIHGSKDTLVAADQVELLTKLAIVEHWAPYGMMFHSTAEACCEWFFIVTGQGAQCQLYDRGYTRNVLGGGDDNGGGGGGGGGSARGGNLGRCG